MEFEFDMEDFINDVREEIVKMNNSISSKSNVDKFLRDCGKEIKENVVENLNRSKEEHTHMEDDVKVSLKTDANGERYVEVGGGKRTGFKWHMLDDGTLNHDGSIHTKATHFTENSLNDSQAGIDKLSDKYVNGAIRDE